MWARECAAAERLPAGCDIFQIRATSVPGLGPAYFWLQIVCKMWFLQAPDTLCATDRVRTVVWGGRRRVKSGDAPIENHAFLFSQLSRAYIGPSIHPHRCTIAAALALILYPYYPHDATTTNTTSVATSYMVCKNTTWAIISGTTRIGRKLSPAQKGHPIII